MRYLFFVLPVAFNITAYILFKTISGSQNNFRLYALCAFSFIFWNNTYLVFYKVASRNKSWQCIPAFFLRQASALLCCYFILFHERLSI